MNDTPMTQAVLEVLKKVDALRKTRGVDDIIPDTLTMRDALVGMAAGAILSLEEMDGDDTEANGWSPK